MSDVMDRKVWADPITAKQRIAELEQEINQKADYNMKAFERIEVLEQELQALREAARVWSLGYITTGEYIDALTKALEQSK